MIYFQIFFLVIALLVVQRSIFGPQKRFARVSALMLLSAWGSALSIEDASSPLAYAAAILAILGLLCAILMLLVQLYAWGSKKYKNRKPKVAK